DAPLTNLTLTPSNAPVGSNFSFSTVPVLAGGASATISYEVSGTVLSPGFNFQAGSLQVVSDQGSIQPQDFYYYCQAPGGLINAS
ncbi:MAG TPA: hypothetical protein PKY96_11835, partial [Flavobacteriales bacterium]|nr:hypothetical protein [Flavobacteriales bacterium]